MNIKITGIGHYLPDTIETSKDLAPKINKTENWIISRTGVKERRVSDIDVDKMGAIAGRIALEQSNSEPDLILNASGVGKQVIPDTSVFFQKELGLKGIPSFTIHATCLSFLVAVHTAANLIEQNSIWGNSITPYVMPQERSYNIDDEIDFITSEMMMKKSTKK